MLSEGFSPWLHTPKEWETQQVEASAHLFKIQQVAAAAAEYLPFIKIPPLNKSHTISARFSL